MKPQAIFFDLDGTLLDSVPDLSNAVDQALLTNDLPKVGEDNVRLWVGNGARKLIERALAFVLSVDEQNIDEKLLDRIHNDFLNAYATAKAKYSRLYPGVKAVLSKLYQSGFPLVVITNKPGQFTPGLLEEHGIAEYFSLVLSGDSLEEKKPHPLPLYHAAKVLGVPVESCLMVGDSRSDIAAANAASVPSVCVTYGYNHGESAEDLPATHHIDEFDKLLELIAV